LTPSQATGQHERKDKVVCVHILIVDKPAARAEAGKMPL
jgi:hypothetical protein